MEQRALEEGGGGGNGEVLPVVPQNSVGRIGRLFLPRQRSGVDPRGEAGEERGHHRSPFWGLFVHRQRSKVSLQNEVGAAAAVTSHNQPQEHISDDQSTPLPSVESTGGDLPQLGTESTPQTKDFTARDFASGPLEHGMEGAFSEEGECATISPQSISVDPTGDHPHQPGAESSLPVGVALYHQGTPHPGHRTQRVRQP